MRDVLEVDEEEARDVAGEVSSERTHGIKYRQDIQCRFDIKVNMVSTQITYIIQIQPCIFCIRFLRRNLRNSTVFYIEISGIQCAMIISRKVKI